MKTPGYVHIRIVNPGDRDLSARALSETIQRSITDLLGPGGHAITIASESPRYAVPPSQHVAPVT